MFKITYYKAKLKISAHKADVDDILDCLKKKDMGMRNGFLWIRRETSGGIL
jgi:hypothetical protein